MSEAARVGEVFITVTGNKHVLRKEHFTKMKSGAVVCNSGHFDVEIDIPALESLARNVIKDVRPMVTEYQLSDHKSIYLLADGRLVNLAAATGHPASVMDMSFANQALSAEYIYQHAHTLEKQVYRVPIELDKQIARLKLDAMGIRIDTLTPEQQDYLTSWEMGT